MLKKPQGRLCVWFKDCGWRVERKWFESCKIVVKAAMQRICQALKLMPLWTKIELKYSNASLFSDHCSTHKMLLWHSIRSSPTPSFTFLMFYKFLCLSDQCFIVSSQLFDTLMLSIVIDIVGVWFCGWRWHLYRFPVIKQVVLFVWTLWSDCWEKALTLSLVLTPSDLSFF